jgi:hypothetical protein
MLAAKIDRPIRHADVCQSSPAILVILRCISTGVAPTYDCVGCAKRRAVRPLGAGVASRRYMEIFDDGVRVRPVWDISEA